jgi:ferredoxin, 2Fe-2S
MKKLTIGSLKYDRISLSVSVDPPVKIDQHLKIVNPSVNETKRIMEIEQNQTHFQIAVKKNQTILDAALEQNLALDYKCKKGTCGKCKVKVVSGRTYLHPANSLEENKLNHLLQTGFRLACQAKAK